jgi:CSLREA domain-containing protein
MTNELRTHARKAHGTTRSASPPPASGQASMLRRVVMTLLLAALSPMAQAAAIIVNTLDDEMNNDGDCSLREAVASANYNLGYDACTAGDSSGWDVILFALPGPGEIPMSQNLVITQAVQIYGGDLVTLRRAPKGASHMIVVDMANPGHDFGLSNIALVDGNNYDGWNRDNAGSAVQLRQADQVTFSNVTFRNNAQSALAHFGGAFPGKQVNSVRVVDCLFERNRATTGTGYTGSGHGGGAIALDRVDNVTVLRSTFRKNGNVHDLPFAYGPGGAIRVQRANSIDISDSLFEQNSARTRSHNGGGAISVEGPYSGTTRAALSVRNSTFVLNRSYADGELLGTDIELVSKAQAIVVNSTFYTAHDSLRVRGESELYLLASTVFDIVVAPRIAGLIRTEAYGRISMQASLLFSYASGPLCEHNSIGYIRSNGLNLFPSSDQSCERHSLDTGIEDPRLLPLGYYGGPVPVMLPRPDSPLIDSGGHYCSNISIHTDARGLPRPVAASGVGPALCDLGAVEWNPDHDPIWIDRLFADGFEG